MNHSDTSTGEIIVLGDARAQAIPVAYLLAGTALEATASELGYRHVANPVAYARHRSTQLISGAIDSMEGDTGDAVHPVVARMAEALVTAEVALLDSLGIATRGSGNNWALGGGNPFDCAAVAGVLQNGADEYVRIGEANV